MVILSLAFVSLLLFSACDSGTDTVTETDPATEESPEPSVVDELGLVDPNMPESWFEDLRTASEWGITGFNQSPVLDARVESGELPPVEERIPNPLVIEPFESIGNYGGTMVLYAQNLGVGNLGHMLAGPGDSGFIIPPDGSNRLLAWYAERYEYNDDFTSITFYFRDGLKWSDGEPFHVGTEIDFLWNHIVLNDTISQGYRPNNIRDVEIVDENTYTLHLTGPDPLFHFSDFVIRDLGFEQPYILGPSHAIREYHPDFIGAEEADRLTSEIGFNNISEAIIALNGQGLAPHEPDYGIPTIRPYRSVERSESVVTYERNPYYPFVDTEGNQLPYIDYIEINRASNREVASVNAVTGQSTMENEALIPDDIPLYIQNEERGGYRTLIYNAPLPAAPFYIMNFTDPTYGHVFRDVRFRQALSLAIDRDDLNERFYFGNATPMQVTAPVTSEFYREEYARAFAEYDPERARALLDEMGMVDVTGDGWRETPEGERFRPELTHLFGNPTFGTPAFHERNIAFWNDIGIDLTMEAVHGPLFWGGRRANDFQMSMHPGDGNMPIIRETYLRRVLAPARSANQSGWNAWARWFGSGGEIGQEPEDELIFELVELANRYLTDLDEDAMHQLLGHLAENLWAIGTVGNVPRPVIVSNSLRNVPERGMMEFALQLMNASRIVQWWLDE